MEEKKKFTVVTLGCRTNQYESQAYADQLFSLGYERALSHEIADICIVNTCTVTASADRSSRHEIRKLQKEHPNAKIVVTGCLAESIDGVSLVVPNKDKEKLVQLALPEEQVPEFMISQFEGHTRAFVKVQDGCNSFCTYCIIPYVRGRSVSRKLDDIVQEVKGLIAASYKEIVITGINVGDFDGNPEEGCPPVRLSDLVRVLDALPGLERLRISSIDPDEVDDDLLDAVISGKHTCPSMHIVLQSGSNAILKRMNRKYTKEMFLQTVNRLKAAHPDFTFTTDVIVGFPGETEEDFQETLSLIEKVKFAKVHMFPYSVRKRTRAALYPNQVPQEVIAERKQRLLRAALRAAFALREEYVGKVASVLIEGGGRGHTEHFLEVKVEGNPNDLIQVKLVGNDEEGLIGVYEN
ncbi:MAG: hypothetical protein RLZZ453_917 [Chlamydiota bacterium]|jgi:threonylcarbamoyladenosine tRNA methylthiotransferase MtaB